MMISNLPRSRTFVAGLADRIAFLLMATFGVLLFASSLFSQGSFGRILGMVSDQTGGVVAGATVTVIDTQRGVARTLTTDQAGEYNAPNLIPGTYTVRVEAQGFKRLERQNVGLEVGKEVEVDLTVQPREQTQSVTVTENIRLVETTNATLGGTLNNEQLIDIPLNGRLYQNLLSLRPGVQVQPGGGYWTQSTNGSRPDETSWMLEGVINVTFYDARPVQGTPSPFTDGATIVPIDATQEFNMMENPKAEYGWKPGAAVNVGIKSGTNTLHGSAYAFGRSQALDARNVFNPQPAPNGACGNNLDPTVCNKSPAQLEQFGGTVGGPIKKDKLFFFGGYEGLRSYIGDIIVGTFSDTSNMVAAITALQNSGATTLCSAAHAGRAVAQTGAEPGPLLAEQAFKNVQLLEGVPVDEFLETMGFFAASTGLNCTECHSEKSGGNWANYADDTPLKQKARMMMLMVTNLNRSSFGGKRMVTCWTCHRGTRSPRVIPDLAIQYSDVIEPEPDEILAQTSGVPSVDQILNKYIQALGGAERVSSLTSFAGKGTYAGYETAFQRVPVDVLAKAPDQRVTIAHMLDRESTATFDGHSGWLAKPETLKPMPLIELTGGDLDGAKIDAELSFPARIKQTLVDWRVGYPEMIDNKEVQVLQGRLTQVGLPVKLYFDSDSGLLVRSVRYTNSLVGVNPTQIDFSDYRDVSGVKLPYHWIVTWTDGRSTIDLSELRANVPIDAAKFAKPGAIVPKKASR
jgi:Carboxypeptidase regulatory-like domain/Photosynthetic reaction centre cytochrome C subunit